MRAATRRCEAGARARRAAAERRRGGSARAAAARHAGLDDARARRRRCSRASALASATATRLVNFSSRSSMPGGNRPRPSPFESEVAPQSRPDTTIGAATPELTPAASMCSRSSGRLRLQVDPRRSAGLRDARDRTALERSASRRVGRRTRRPVATRPRSPLHPDRRRSGRLRRRRHRTAGRSPPRRRQEPLGRSSVATATATRLRAACSSARVASSSRACAFAIATATRLANWPSRSSVFGASSRSRVTETTRAPQIAPDTTIGPPPTSRRARPAACGAPRGRRGRRSPAARARRCVRPVDGVPRAITITVPSPGIGTPGSLHSPTMTPCSARGPGPRDEVRGVGAQQASHLLGDDVEDALGRRLGRDGHRDALQSRLLLDQHLEIRSGHDRNRRTPARAELVLPETVERGLVERLRTHDLPPAPSSSTRSACSTSSSRPSARSPRARYTATRWSSSATVQELGRGTSHL